MSMELVTGYAGQGHISSDDAGRFNAGVVGTGKYVLNTGTRFSAYVLNNQEVEISSGDAVDQGRHIIIHQGTTETVPLITPLYSGGYYWSVVYFRYEKDSSTGVESVRLDSVTGDVTRLEEEAVIPTLVEGNIFDGALRDEMPLYYILFHNGVMQRIETAFTVVQSLTDIMPNGNIILPETNKGIYGVDQASNEYPLIKDNGVNLWIGAEASNQSQHVGGTNISAGYNPSTNKGYSTANIYVANDANTGATPYGIWHAGNMTRFYSDATTNTTITRNSTVACGLIGGNSKTITLLLPYPVVGGNPTLTDLTINLAIPGNAYVRSGSSGGTYTNVSGVNISMVANGSYVRSNEIDEVTIQVQRNIGFRVSLNMKYALSTTSGSATTLPNKTSFTAWVTYTITLS